MSLQTEASESEPVRIPKLVSEDVDSLPEPLCVCLATYLHPDRRGKKEDASLVAQATDPHINILPVLIHSFASDDLGPGFP